MSRELYKRVYAEHYLNEGITKESIISQQIKLDKIINDTKKMVQAYEKANDIKKGMILDYVDELDKFTSIQFDDIGTTIDELAE